MARQPKGPVTQGHFSVLCYASKNQATTLAWLWSVCKKNASYVHISRGKQRTPSLPCQICMETTNTTISSPWNYLEEVESDLAEIEITKPKNNLPPAEREALRALKRGAEINLKKADKGTIIVVMNTQDKIKEGQILLSPMVTETNHKVKQTYYRPLRRGSHRRHD